MSVNVEWPEERQERQNQEFMREDTDNYCPRHDEQVLILGRTCFCKNRDRVCSGCVFDSEPIRVKLIWLMSEILQESDLEKKESEQKVARKVGPLTRGVSLEEPF